MRLILVRHAQTEWNQLRKAQGHTDIPLDETGLSQASQLGKFLSSRQQQLGIDEILSSDLSRCIQTIQPTADLMNLEIHPDKRLRERSFGKWEGLDYGELKFKMQSLSLNPEIARPPGGESTEDVWQRTLSLLEMIDKRMKSAIIVTHGGMKALLLARLLQGNIATARSFHFQNTSLTELERRPDGTFALMRFASTEHLEQQNAHSSFGIIG